MRKVKVLLIPVVETFHPWCEDVVNTVGPKHDLRIFDASRPAGPQFDQIDVVIDHGGLGGTADMIDLAAGVKLWQILATGFDHFDLEYTKARGIPVANCPGQFSAASLSESAMMFVLMLAHRYRQAAADFHAGVFAKCDGAEVEGRTLGIIGFGASGQALARRARAFGMKVLAVDVRTIDAEVLDQIQPEFLGSDQDIDRILPQCDFISLHVPLDPQTRHIIDKNRLGRMKPTACLINVARGELVEEDALYEALVAGRLGGAGLDVFATEPPDPKLAIYQLTNVVVTPHIAACTDGASRKRSRFTLENVNRIAQGLDPLYRIDQ